MAEIIPGLETIRNLTGQPPMEIPIDKDTVVKQQEIMQGWNGSFIAVIPYCYKCKMPLTWHTPPDTDELFHCPNCQRKWVKGSDWEGSKRNLKLKQAAKDLQKEGENHDNNRRDGQHGKEHTGEKTQ